MKPSKKIMGLLLGILCILLIAGCGKDVINKNAGNVQSEVQKTEENMGKTIAVIETTKGTIKAELYTKDAPITTANFIELANAKFYDGLTFHRYVPGFVIQGGDPDGDGTGGSDKSIPLEIKENLKHNKGALAMARTADPNSATSQFYITLEETPFLDGQYAVFGQVIEGMDVVAQLRADDVMKSITISK